ncbi:MAG TPA: NAD(P)/FAD-dependent oxidoreductase [Nocardioidaceae bacterium]|nr:NAD(P)/FAD-dependent oxidoreductase [Nocardioidaceae bacterium]
MNDTFDGIVIGSGQHGLVLACYLQKQGLNVLLLERRMQYGGGLMTEDVTLPGFHHNLHSINHWDLLNTPWYRDLNLADRVPYVTPKVEFSQPHRDGTALVFSRNLEKTVASIARFSDRDAATFRDWNRKAEIITKEIFVPERFSEPLSKEERDDLLGQTATGRDFLSLTRQQPFELVTNMFESEQVQVFLLFKLSLFGTVLYDMIREESPTGSILRGFDIDTGYDLCQGGSWNLARGLMEVFIANGGTFLNHADVTKVVVSQNRATGVELADGRSFSARQFVSSTLNVHQTFDGLVTKDQLTPEFVAKVDRFHYTPWALFGLHLALEEAPRYTSTDYDPDVNNALKFNIGSETLQKLMSVHDVVKEGRVPGPDDIQFGAGAMTVIDPTQAPAGKHLAYAWQIVPYDKANPDLVESHRERIADLMVDKWRDYAPNLTDGNILGRYTYTPHDYAQALPNMATGDIFMGAFTSDQVMYNHFGYRTPIEGLYMSGSAAHPGGAISGGVGYITAKVICEDLDLTPWWHPVDAATSIRRFNKSHAD